MKNTLAAPALVAGLLAAILLTLIQTLWVSPLIWQAESFEHAAPHEHAAPDHHSVPHEHAAAVAEDHVVAQEHHHADAAEAHHHDDSEWSPDDGWQRIAFTGASNLVMSVGYALAMVALFHWRKPKSVVAGIGWGIAGFVVFFGAPSLGLPPELPGTAAAELTSRQTWWIATALCTAVAMGLIGFRKDWLSRAIAPVLLLAPHIYGAPQSARHESLAPEALHHQFVIATSIANGVFWLALGLCCAWFYRAWRVNNHKSASA
jgi:cobalt transporter subunit CbtA